MLERLNSIENSFSALENIVNSVDNKELEATQNQAKNEDFKTILDNINKKNDIDELKTDDIPKEIKEDLKKIRELGYEKVMVDQNENFLISELILSYMRSLEDMTRKERFEQALDFVEQEFEKEVSAWMH